MRGIHVILYLEFTNKDVIWIVLEMKPLMPKLNEALFHLI